ncbi:hypothetical protein MSPP1_001582 [Malassezia sp. CBS 17886]|nr:hypothetical protein MSPP1_001582 [Malassezia sp. CBS 17886]
MPPSASGFYMGMMDNESTSSSLSTGILPTLGSLDTGTHLSAFESGQIDQRGTVWPAGASFAETSDAVATPSFTSNDLQRSISQPTGKRRSDDLGWGLMQNGRDALSANEFLRALCFGAAIPG